MPQKKEHKWYQQATRLFAAVFTVGMMWACANIGMPEGGPFDVTPPKLISASPSERSTRSSALACTLTSLLRLTDKIRLLSRPLSVSNLLSHLGVRVYTFACKTLCARIPLIAFTLMMLL